MTSEGQAVINEMRFEMGHVGERVHMQILIIGQDEQYVGLFRGLLERSLLGLCDGIGGQSDQEKGYES